MNEPRILWYGAGKPPQVQAEIELEALPPEERALSVASDFLLAAKAGSGGGRRLLVRAAVLELSRHFPEQVREAGK